MLDVTYIYTSYTNITDLKKDRLDAWPSTPRVMTNILNNQKDLRVTYSTIPLLISLAYIEYCKNELNPNWTKFHYEFCKEIVKTIKTEYVLLTLGNPWEIIFLGILIDAGKKVVVGGPYVKSYDLEILREMFKVNGCKNLDNVIIVRPFINKDVNIYNIIQLWKDIDMDIVYDCSDIYLTESDFYLSFKPTFKNHKILFKRFSIISQTTCGWGKCSFCKYSVKTHSKKFINSKNFEEVMRNTFNLMKQVGATKLNIMDPEFYFTKTNCKILNEFRKKGYKVIFFVSVRQLLNDDFFDNIFIKYSDVIQSILIGFECIEDFSLKLLNKGVNENDTFKIIQKICNYKSDVGILALFMSNLATNNKDAVTKNYKNIKKFKDMCNQNDIKYNFSFSEFNANPLSEYTTNNPYLRLKYHPLYVLNDYDRVDENGNIFSKHDSKIIDSELYNEIIEFFRWGNI